MQITLVEEVRKVLSSTLFHKDSYSATSEYSLKHLMMYSFFQPPLIPVSFCAFKNSKRVWWVDPAISQTPTQPLTNTQLSIEKTYGGNLVQMLCSSRATYSLFPRMAIKYV